MTVVSSHSDSGYVYTIIMCTVNPERIASVIFNDFINPATLTSLYDNDFSRRRFLFLPPISSSR